MIHTADCLQSLSTIKQVIEVAPIGGAICYCLNWFSENSEELQKGQFCQWEGGMDWADQGRGQLSQLDLGGWGRGEMTFMS